MTKKYEMRDKATGQVVKVFDKETDYRAYWNIQITRARSSGIDAGKDKFELVEVEA